MGGVTVVLALVAAVAVVVAVVLIVEMRRARRRIVGITRLIGEPRTPEGAPSLTRAAEELEELAAVSRDRRVGLEVELARLAHTLRVSQDGVVIVDREGRTVLRNAEAARLAGARHADATVDDVVAGILERALQGEALERELQMFGPPRQVLRIIVFPLTDRLELIGAATIIRDVSETRRLESVRRDFVANVSHELKTPIGALGLLAETMADGDVDAVTRQLAERMTREADRLGRTIDDLLDLTMIEAQEVPVRESVSLAGLLGDTVERMREVADSRGVPLQIVDARPSLAVVGDRRQLMSAVVNLVDNAIKYSESGQPVELSTVARPEGRVAIVVRDHGIGIPRRDLERIFERFYRVDEARSRQTGGTGLGLAIVRHVTQLHGGEVRVHSEEGEGSTFELSFPGTGRSQHLAAS